MDLCATLLGLPDIAWPPYRTCSVYEKAGTGKLKVGSCIASKRHALPKCTLHTGAVSRQLC